MDKLQRLNFINQYLILEKLYPEESDYYKNHRKALEHGYELHYSWLTEHIYDELPEEECQEILEILDMYRVITFSYQKLHPGKEIPDSYRFVGFDGNNETSYMGYVQYFINDLDRFQELTYGSSYCQFNSHFPSINMYRRQVEKWKELDKKLQLSLPEINTILGVE